MSDSGIESGAPAAPAEGARTEELTQRIETLSSLDDEELGSWTAFDWVLILFLGVVGPLLVLYGFAP